MQVQALGLWSLRARQEPAVVSGCLLKPPSCFWTCPTDKNVHSATCMRPTLSVGRGVENVGAQCWDSLHPINRSYHTVTGL